ncbi:MAG TPA: FAD-linked oxidase C-terminal domain-containing protein [Armatimonadota bacterium]|nr:FAD-linked oxidase C-terminal domain-containing protein [Armatimonadota bacterium]
MIASTLQSHLPKGRVLSDPESLIAYGYDGGTWLTGEPEAVVMVHSEEEAVAVLRLAHEQGVPVFPRGAGSGLAGGAVPNGGIVLNFAPMNRILEIDEESLMAVVEPGVVTADLQAAVEARGLFYPPDPASLKQSTIGGNVSTGAGGPRCLKYGTTREYVRGMHAVLPGGQVMTAGGKYLKSATGYNLAQIFVGAEGTLGAVTQVTLRLIPKPPATGTALALFASLDDAAAIVTRILKAGILPSVIEFIDRQCIQCIEQTAKLGLPDNVDALLLIECDGHPASVENEIAHVTDICRDGGALSVERATDDEKRDQLWKARRSVSPSLSRLRPSKLGEDISLPRAAIVPMVRRLQQIARDFDVLLPTFGHIGDGNLHPNLVFDPRDEAEMERVGKAAEVLIKSAVELGGTLSGEHGIGLLKKDYLPFALPPENLELYRQLKAVFDPKGIMNPGKVF